jgi:hypothetical protein
MKIVSTLFKIYYFISIYILVAWPLDESWVKSIQYRYEEPNVLFVMPFLLFEWWLLNILVNKLERV